MFHIENASEVTEQEVKFELKFERLHKIMTTKKAPKEGFTKKKYVQGGKCISACVVI